MSVDPVSVRRFDEGAPQEAKAEFARQLMFALTTIGVKPGMPFFVATQGMLDAYDKAAEQLKEDWENKVQDLENSLAENEHKGELYDDLVEALKDVPRGIRSVEEVLDAEGIK